MLLSENLHIDIIEKKWTISKLAHFQRKDGSRQQKTRNSNNLKSSLMTFIWCCKALKHKNKNKKTLGKLSPYILSHISILFNNSNVELYLSLAQFKGSSYNQTTVTWLYFIIGSLPTSLGKQICLPTTALITHPGKLFNQNLGLTTALIYGLHFFVPLWAH